MIEDMKKKRPKSEGMGFSEQRQREKEMKNQEKTREIIAIRDKSKLEAEILRISKEVIIRVDDRKIERNYSMRRNVRQKRLS